MTRAPALPTNDSTAKQGFIHWRHSVVWVNFAVIVCATSTGLAERLVPDDVQGFPSTAFLFFLVLASMSSPWVFKTYLSRYGVTSRAVVGAILWQQVFMWIGFTVGYFAPSLISSTTAAQVQHVSGVLWLTVLFSSLVPPLLHVWMAGSSFVVRKRLTWQRVPLSLAYLLALLGVYLSHEADGLAQLAWAVLVVANGMFVMVTIVTNRHRLLHEQP